MTAPAVPPVSAADASASARLDRLSRTASGPGAASKADDTAKSFEAMFLSQFMQSMFSGLKSDGAFGGGHAEKMWRDMLAEQISEAAAGRGGFGIADAVRRQIVAMDMQAPEGSER